MTAPRSINSYPPAFLTAVQRAYSDGSFTIPCKAASFSVLRMQMYGFLKAMRNSGQSLMADAIAIQNLPGNAGVRLVNRDQLPVNLDIEAALQETGEALPTKPIHNKLFGEDTGL